MLACDGGAERSRAASVYCWLWPATAQSRSKRVRWGRGGWARAGWALSITRVDRAWNTCKDIGKNVTSGISLTCLLLKLTSVMNNIHSFNPKMGVTWGKSWSAESTNIGWYLVAAQGDHDGISLWLSKTCTHWNVLSPHNSYSFVLAGSVQCPLRFINCPEVSLESEYDTSAGRSGIINTLVRQHSQLFPLSRQYFKTSDWVAWSAPSGTITVTYFQFSAPTSTVTNISHILSDNISLSCFEMRSQGKNLWATISIKTTRSQIWIYTCSSEGYPYQIPRMQCPTRIYTRPNKSVAWAHVLQTARKSSGFCAAERWAGCSWNKEWSAMTSGMPVHCLIITHNQPF